MALQRPRLKGTISKPTILESWKCANYSASWCRWPPDLYSHNKRLQDRPGRSQGLAPRTEELSQPSWTHQGQGLHAAKAEVTATKTGSM
uniref:Uncharacterized protein n=1 Tax=Aegilops tauschii TaxID=37682 RepID=M8BZZ8_AEGTA